MNESPLRYDTRTVETVHTGQFGDLHVSYFDIFNRKKDYRAEVEQVHAIFAREGTVSTVLDIGCGTGRHLELLAESWYEVVGVDRSEPMVRRARQRLARFGPKVSVVEADLFELSLQREFDAVTMMFALLGCFVSNDKVLSALAVANRHLRTGGLLVLDVFDAAALLPAKTPLSGGSVQSGGRHPLLAGHVTAVNTGEQAVELTLQMWELDGDRVLDRMLETHVIRYFVKRELRLLLTMAGFELIDYTPMSAATGNPAQPWLRQAAARKVGAPRPRGLFGTPTSDGGPPGGVRHRSRRQAGGLPERSVTQPAHQRPPHTANTARHAGPPERSAPPTGQRNGHRQDPAAVLNDPRLNMTRSRLS